MGYIEDESMVRVDFFRLRNGRPGKWCCTEGVKWTGGWARDDGLIHDALKKSLKDHLKGRLRGMVAICLEPYHELSHPILVYTDEL